MEFTPLFKRKRVRINLKNAPFPPFPEEKLYQGVFNGLCVEVADAEHARIKSLHENGVYGKGSCSRGGPVSREPDETLLLGLEEAFFLCYNLGVLQIRDMGGDEIGEKSFLEEAIEIDKKFFYKLAAYLYLKSKAWIIKSGIKFGGDFLIYKQSPREYHASILVLVHTPLDKHHSHYVVKNLKGLHRVAETSDKDVLILMVSKLNDVEPSLVNLESLAIEETVICRFNHTSFVQIKNKRL